MCVAKVTADPLLGTLQEAPIQDVCPPHPSQMLSMCDGKGVGGVGCVLCPALVYIGLWASVELPHVESRQNQFFFEAKCIFRVSTFGLSSR